MTEDILTCPICRKNPFEDQCNHLLYYSDDVSTEILVGVAIDISKYKFNRDLAFLDDDPIPKYASVFLEFYKDHFPSLHLVEEFDYRGEKNNEVKSNRIDELIFIWATDKMELADEIIFFLNKWYKERDAVDKK